MRKVFIILCSFCILSCNNNDDIPSGIIQPAQMQQIFWDMIRGDILAQEVIKKDSLKNLEKASAEISEKILDIHKVDRSKFRESLTFYEKHPAIMKIIFDSLNAIQTRNNIHKIEMRSRPVRPIPLSPARKIP